MLEKGTYVEMKEAEDLLCSLFEGEYVSFLAWIGL